MQKTKLAKAVAFALAGAALTAGSVSTKPFYSQTLLCIRSKNNS
ncbi:MAG: hypothetical protein QX196_03795 [Methylococcaceae bacterium]